MFRLPPSSTLTDTLFPSPRLFRSNAEGNYGPAVGYGSAATGESSVAVGGLADLIPGWGFLVGTEASGYGASAFGAGAYAPGDSSTAIALLAAARRDSPAAVGANMIGTSTRLNSSP